jgi:hypothetical protein
MKTGGVLLAFAVAVALFAVPVFAQDVTVTVAPGEIKSDVDINNVFQLTVTNNQGRPDIFKMVPNGPYIYWVTPTFSLIDLQSGESKTLDITIFPIGDRFGRFPFTATVTSTSNPVVSDMTSFYLDVEPVRINDISPEKRGGTVFVTMEVNSMKRRDVSFAVSVRETSGRVVSSSSFNEQIDGTQTVSSSVSVPDNLLSGTYDLFVEATADGATIKKSTPLVIGEVHDMVKTRAEVDTALYREITITVRNNGNVIEDNYKVTESTSPGQLVGFITAPNDCASTNQGSTCSYVVSGLAPGATAKVVYRIEYWPTLMQYIGAIIVVVAVLGFTFVHKTKPSIRKTSLARGSGMHSIVIEVKNPFLHHMSNVVVRDFVHPIANVVHEEIESLKPVVRKTEEGTELIWKLGDVKPKETRLLKYGVKSVFQGDTISSPKASIRFMNPKGKSFRIYSNAL